MTNDAEIFDLAERFHAAAFGVDTWSGALEALAALTGSRSWQLIGIGANGATPFNHITNFEPEYLSELAAVDGHNPLVNPRVRAGSKAAVFQVLTEANFITPEDHRSSIIYRDYFTRMDIPYICLTNIIQEREMLIGLTVNRSRREGHANDDVRRTLAAIAPHVRMAVRAQIALEGQGAQLIAGAFEALSIAAFVCDSACRVLARTPVTDTLIGADQPLALKGGRLTAAAQPNATALTEAVAATALRMQPSMSAIVLRRDPPHAPLILDVAPLPRRAHGFSFEAQVLIVARMARSNNIEKIALMRAVFGLTQAEAEVACALLRGETIAAVSQSRGASENTIRAQTKAIYDKMGVTNRAEFAAHLGQFA